MYNSNGHKKMQAVDRDSLIVLAAHSHLSLEIASVLSSTSPLPFNIRLISRYN